MNKKQNAHFTNLPKLKVGRSMFDMSYGVKTSMNVGQVVPIGPAIEIMPGDTFKYETFYKAYLTTLVAPVLDSLFLDTYFFFVPFRLVWEHYVNFLGENDTTPWVNPTTYSIPQITSPEGGWNIGTLADYFGVPTGVGNLSISSLPFRAYAKIIKEWFYDENVETPPDVLVDDATIAGSNGGDYVTDLIKGGVPFDACKSHDMFTSVLPAPQKGPSVSLPLGSDATVYATGSENVPFMTFEQAKAYNNSTSNAGPLHYSNSTTGVSSSNHILGVDSLGYNQQSSGTYTSQGGLYVDNLHADLSSATGTTINDLRLAFQTQRLLERMARGGSRYYEILASQWGITPPEGLIQRSEYLGGNRSKINIQTIVQSSQSTDQSPLGDLAGYSINVHVHKDFTKSFSEAGYLIPLACVRYFHSYQQGIPKTYLRKDLYDFYNHAFAYIGEQPILNAEIYAQGTSQDNEVFGYNEAWIQNRNNMSVITGQLRSQASQSLDVYHFADYYSALPTLSTDWIKEDKSNIDRSLVYSSSVVNQLIFDFYFKVSAVRPMPLYSIPGLIDHM